MGVIRDNLARGLARQFERDIGRFLNAGRQGILAFAQELLKENERGVKIEASRFNAALPNVISQAGKYSGHIRTDRLRMGLGRRGSLHRQSLQSQEVRHFRADGSNFSKQEWLVAIDDVQITKGLVSAAFWSAPVLFDSHLVIRFLERKQGGTPAEIPAIIGDALPFAMLYRAVGIVGGGRQMAPIDVVIPVPGGVLCGGVELVDCRALAYRIAVGRLNGRCDTFTITGRGSMYVTISLRTYLDNALLSADQRRVLDALCRWGTENIDKVRQDPQATFAWDIENTSDRIDRHVLTSFRPLCDEVQHHFASWRNELQSQGYFEIDFKSMADGYRIPPPQQAAIQPDVHGKYMKM